MTPYYNKTSQKGLAAHFIAIADATPLPVILYNVPSRTGLNLLPETCQLLCSHPHIRGLKEAGTSLHQAQKTLLLCKDKLDLYSGNDDLLLPFLSIGAKGVISVASNLLPQTFHDICSLFRQGNTEECRRRMEKYWELTEALFSDVNPIPIKQALNWAGLSAGFCRALYVLWTQRRRTVSARP